MKIGINYDTGFFPGDRKSRPVFDPEQVAFDMKAIARDLHCSAVRVSGGDVEKMTIAGDLAAAEGMEVWLSPQPCDLDEDEMLDLVAKCAKQAENLRRRSEVNVTLVVGCELSVFGRGFLPGANVYERMRCLVAPPPGLMAEYPKILERFNSFLAKAVEAARARFAGPVTYASGPWEQVDWTPFGVASLDAYRDQSNAANFDQEIAALSAHGKPAAVTEFGCCTYRGAADKGAMGWAIVEGKGEDQQLNGDYVRDEDEQVTYLRELVEIYERHGVDTAFWFTFASWNRPHREGRSERLGHRLVRGRRGNR